MVWREVYEVCIVSFQRYSTEFLQFDIFYIRGYGGGGLVFLVFIKIGGIESRGIKLQLILVGIEQVLVIRSSRKNISNVQSVIIIIRMCRFRVGLWIEVLDRKQRLFLGRIGIGGFLIYFVYLQKFLVIRIRLL